MQAYKVLAYRHKKYYSAVKGVTQQRYYINRRNCRKKNYGPLACFLTIEAAKDFIITLKTVFGSADKYKIFLCNVKLSRQKKLTHPSKPPRRFSSLPLGSLLVNSLKIVKEV